MEACVLSVLMLTEVSAHVNNLFAVIRVRSIAICLFYYIGPRDGGTEGWRDGTASRFRQGKAINNDLSSGIRINKVFPWLDSAALIYHSRGGVICRTYGSWILHWTGTQWKCVIVQKRHYGSFVSF